VSEQADKQTPDIVKLWQDWLTQSERQFNALFSQAMNGEEFARSVGGSMEMYAGFQRLISQGMERYLAMVNMPSRTDVAALGETLRAMDARLARIEEMLLIAAEAVDVTKNGSGEPTRTRRPPGVPASNKADDDQTIPAEFTR
jgi:hypothetical protein